MDIVLSDPHCKTWLIVSNKDFILSEYLKNRTVYTVCNNTLKIYENKKMVYEKYLDKFILEETFSKIVQTNGLDLLIVDEEIENYGVLIYKYSFLVSPNGIIYSHILDTIPENFLMEGNYLRRKCVKQFSNETYGIKMATFQRKTGNSPQYIKRSIDSVITQSFDNWVMFVGGDRYDDNTEFESIVKKYGDNRIIAINLPIAYERDTIDNPYLRWGCAGMTTMNYLFMLARWHGIKRLCHMDDDDYWSENHIRDIDEGFRLHESVAFVYTCSKYKERYLPNSDYNLGLNNLMPKQSNIVHASTCIDLTLIPFVYQWDGFGPVDSIMWEMIAKYITENELYSVYNNKISVFKECDGPREDNMND